ncbi:hypothetical protein FNT36_15430 [Hymenobacter setariae]|uniref:Uncharacterized protein n=1 Tax=Hymenobacter setariae TaxID=2594794 RepID=A0A558BRA8_9BACT|nr:hypothetical protein [Hymenobacter setariae]TVT39054.1 hypothetical protein FNT36_15430 [Hymenobacter setariae]
MKGMSKQRTYQKVFVSKHVALPLALVIGFLGGLLGAGYIGIKAGHEIVPTEIVITPPPPNTTWCSPDVAFSGAEKFNRELALQLLAAHTTQYNDAVLNKSIKTVMRQDALGREGYYQLHLLAVTPKEFAVVSMPSWETNPGRYTLITEHGCFYLHAIPKRRHEKYDSLASVRLGYQN